MVCHGELSTGKLPNLAQNDDCAKFDTEITQDISANNGTNVRKKGDDRCDVCGLLLFLNR